jgi:hypothetical protein
LIVGICKPVVDVQVVVVDDDVIHVFDFPTVD